jgi:hypothetical protein
MSAGTRSRAMTAQAWKKVKLENHRNLQFKKPRDFLENILKGVFLYF